MRVQVALRHHRRRYFVWESLPPWACREGFVWQEVTIHRSSAVLSGCLEDWPLCVIYDRLNLDQRGNLFVSVVSAADAQVCLDLPLGIFV